MDSRLVSDKLELGFRYPCDGPGKGDWCVNSTTINGWLRNFLWSQAAQVIQSYGTSISGSLSFGCLLDVNLHHFSVTVPTSYRLKFTIIRGSFLSQKLCSREIFLSQKRALARFHFRKALAGASRGGAGLRFLLK